MSDAIPPVTQGRLPTDSPGRADSKAALAEIDRSFALARDYDVFGLDVRLYTRR